MNGPEESGLGFGLGNFSETGLDFPENDVRFSDRPVLKRISFG